MCTEVIVELPGLARVQSDRKEVSLTVEGGMTWRDVIAALAQPLPALVGQVITDDGRDLIGDYMLSWEGRRTIRDLDQVAKLEEGDRIMLLDIIC